MVDCTTDLNDLQVNVTRCEYHISVENDPDNWWYSPFDVTGLSGSYILQSSGPGSAFDRGSVEFDTFSTNPNIQCSTGSSENWTDANPGKCIDVDGTPKTKLADTQTSQSLSQGQCTGTNQRWIEGPTAFSPSDVSLTPGQYTHYDMEGCVADCVTPDLNVMSMEEAPAGPDNKSYRNFNQNVKCKDDHHPPAALIAGTNVDEYLSGVGVSVPVCVNPGEEYIVHEPCTRNCLFPSADGLSHQGYDMATTEAAINASPQAKARMGIAHWDPDVIGPLVQCSSGYTKGGDNSFVGACSVEATPFILNPNPDSDSGCIADCTPDPNSVPYLYDGGVQSVGLTPVANGAPANDPLPDVPWRDSGSVSFSCPPGYEPGPGAIPGLRADGSVIYSTPTYQHCGKLLGDISQISQSDSSGLWQDAGFVETRKNYAVTGCYPVCDPNTHICLNYSSESDYDVSTDSGPPAPSVDLHLVPENTWRTEIGVALGVAEPQLGENNISYVRRQVTNERDPVTSDGKEIYEWQFKCSKEVCTMTGEAGKINLQTLLGDDGIPAAPTPSLPDPAGVEQTMDASWHIGASGESCTDTCSAAGDLICREGNWGVSDQASLDATMAEVGLNDFWQYCPLSYAATGASAPAAPFFGSEIRADNGCAFSPVIGGSPAASSCAAILPPMVANIGYRRLCKCEVPGTDPAAPVDLVIPTDPAAPVDLVDPSGSSWILGADGDDCITTCGTGTCDAGDWGITSEASMTTAMVSAGVDVSSVCHGGFPGVNYNPFMPGVDTPNGRCFIGAAEQLSPCGQGSQGWQRLCKCDPP